jgi:type VI secretion system protein ImpG
MDPRLLRYYNQELQHLREVGAEFAREFPKIAARLGMEGIEVTDPYVERLLEGTAFLAARVQLKLDAEFPRFTERLLEIVYPNYLAPTPAMLLAQFKPDLSDANLARGFVIRRGAALRSQLGRDDQTACEFRTAHDVTLWPLEITGAEYFSYAPDLPLAQLPVAGRVKGGVRLRLRTTAGLASNQVAIDRLQLFLAGADEVALKLYELAIGAPAGVLVGPAAKPWAWHEFLPPAQIQRAGYADAEALLPAGARIFQGYRLLQEYFAFPQRFLFVEVAGLAQAFQRQTASELEVVLLFERGEPTLENVVDAGNFALHCTPAVNLFAKRADRIHVNDGSYDFHVVPDRTRPMDFEVFEITEVTGFGAGSDGEQSFLPFYAAYQDEDPAGHGYFTVQREPRMLSEAQRRSGFRTSYIGSEVFVSLVDPGEAPWRGDLRQLGVATLCTNRDLPLTMPLGAGRTDFTLETAAPVEAIRCLKGPSRPSSPVRDGGAAWRFISHLALNYLALVDANEREGAAALREMLELYAVRAEPGPRRQIEGVRGVRVDRVVRRLPAAGPIAFGRGLVVQVEVDELAFQGASAFLLGCVLEQFFARYVSINSFTETVLRSTGRGEIKRWIPRWGERLIL